MGIEKMLKKKIKNYKKGMKITKPCIIRGMPDSVYHSEIGLSTSGLKMLLDCPAKYYHKYLSGEFKQKEKPHFKIGKACHTYILEGQKIFEEKYWHNPYKNLLVEEIKAQLDLFKISYKSIDKKDFLMDLLLSHIGIKQEGVELDNNELNQIVSIGRSINNNEFAKNAFSQEGESELSIFWVDETSGLWLKCRPDFLPYNCKDVPDYKTCTSANPRTFYSDFIKFGYHLQAANYRAGINAIIQYFNLDLSGVESFFFIAQEKEPPFITQVYYPDMNIIDYGDKAIRKAINIYADCINKEFWDTYSNHIVEMSLLAKPEDLIEDYDQDNAIVYAPFWVDKELLKY